MTLAATTTRLIHSGSTIARVRYDVFLADCPARTTLGLVADTWSVVVVYGLGDRPMRYSELHARIGGISKKMLTQTLHKLERNGLVTSQRLPTAPPGVEYRLTALGETLLDPVRSLSRWAELHADALLDAQAAAA
jgi:DNA-binding HxlR family transcriptional regulator